MNQHLFTDNHEAKCAYSILKNTNRSVFLTGKAGTGKSTFIQWARSISQTVDRLMAPTGVAAQHVGGKTIHSIFHLPSRLVIDNDDSFFSTIHFKRDDGFILYNADLIIIDEISMVTSAMLDCVDRILRDHCKSEEPFAGKKLLMVGDPFQLPPVIKKEELRELKKYYKSEQFFDSKVFKQLNPVNIELQTIYRQKDKKFFELLNNIRISKNLYQSVKDINKACHNKNVEQLMNNSTNAIMLTFTNESATRINEFRLENIAEEKYTFDAIIKGDFDYRDCLAERILKLKVGARVMMIKNAEEYVNGTLGIITEITKDTISITDDNGKEFKTGKEIWETIKPVQRKGKDRHWTSVYETVGSLIQFPIKLAWAITVHKSQGLTFDNVILLNNNYAFANAQIYVALSRCRSIEGLQILRPLSMRDIKIDSRIIEFCKQLDFKEMEQLIEQKPSQKKLTS